MPKKLTIEEVKDYCLSVNSEFRDSQYKTAKDIYLFKCTKCDYEFKTSYDKFKQGKNRLCDRCSPYIKWDLEKVKSFCLTKNSEFLSKSFNTVDDKYKFKCSDCGLEFTTSFSKFKSREKIKCNSCNNMNRYNFDYVYNYIKNNNCVLLSNEYKNYSSKLKIKCACGNIYYTSFAKFKLGNKTQCNKCSYEKLSQFKKHSHQYIKDYLKKLNSELYSEIYIGNRDKILVKCVDCGEKFYTSFKKNISRQ